MADIKKITDIPELTKVVGTETVVGTSDGVTVRIPVEKISGASLEELASLPELTEAAGDETVIGVSNGSAVRIPVDAIGGGGAEPMFLRSTSTGGYDSSSSVVFLDGSSVTIDDIYNAFIVGTPIFIGYTAYGDANDLGYSVSSPLSQVICVDRIISKISFVYTTSNGGTIISLTVA